VFYINLNIKVELNLNNTGRQHIDVCHVGCTNCSMGRHCHYVAMSTHADLCAYVQTPSSSTQTTNPAALSWSLRRRTVDLEPWL